MMIHDVVDTAKRTLRRLGRPKSGPHAPEGDDAVNVADLPSRARTVAAADVIEGEDETVVVLDVPGATRASTDITIAGRDLQVLARRVDTPAPDAFDWQRQFKLSDTVETELVRADMSGGVLTIHLPKLPAARPRRIQVGGPSSSLPS